MTLKYKTADNLAEVSRSFNFLPDYMKDKVLRAATHKYAMTLAKGIRKTERFTDRTGALRKSIVASKGKRSNPEVRSFVNARMWYAAIVENGTARGVRPTYFFSKGIVENEEAALQAMRQQFTNLLRVYITGNRPKWFKQGKLDWANQRSLF